MKKEKESEDEEINEIEWKEAGYKDGWQEVIEKKKGKW